MEAFEQERRGLFDGLSVPVSVNGTLIAAMGLVAFWAGIRIIEENFGVPGEGECRLIGGMLANLSARAGAFGQWLAELGGWKNEVVHYNAGIWILFWSWTAVVWSFFSGAICRTAAVKLAREEVIEISEALRFGARKFLANLSSIGFVFLIGGLFLLFINATIGGWLARIPYLGDIGLGLLFPLILLSTCLAVFVAALGILGFNLASAAIATEASDPFDGVSRAWNYVLARPWQVLLTLFATFLYLSLVVFFGQVMLKASVRTLALGEWGMGNAPRLVEVTTEQRELHKLPKGVRHVLLPGKGDYLYKRVVLGQYRPEEVKPGEFAIKYPQGLEFALEKYKEAHGEYPPTLQALLTPPAGPQGAAKPYLDVAVVPTDEYGQAFVYTRTPGADAPYSIHSPGADRQLGTPDDVGLVELERQLGPKGPKLNIKPFLESTIGFEVGMLNFWLGLARILLYAYVVAYFLSGQTLVYFLLRKDVEGDDYTEVTLDEELDDLEDDVLGYVAPAKPDATSTPTATPASKPSEPSPAAKDADAKDADAKDADAKDADAKDADAKDADA
ncbi:MAG: type II secretion system protein GspG, partial [Planctomycetes bacterium]|nr:type II secretion system protein GspG [Planctomycetota bacterium]